MRPEPVDIRGAIEEGGRVFTATFAGGDAAAMAALYTETSRSFIPKSQVERTSRRSPHPLPYLTWGYDLL